MLTIHDTNCCAVREIHDLATHYSPKDAIQRFCQLHENPFSMGGWRSIYSFYIFTGVEENEDEEDDEIPLGYGSKFKAFIEKNGLGKVSETEGVYNRVNHPNHLVHVWVWSPNVDALKLWWSKNTVKA